MNAPLPLFLALLQNRDFQRSRGKPPGFCALTSLTALPYHLREYFKLDESPGFFWKNRGSVVPSRGHLREPACPARSRGGVSCPPALGALPWRQMPGRFEMKILHAITLGNEKSAWTLNFRN